MWSPKGAAISFVLLGTISLAATTQNPPARNPEPGSETERLNRNDRFVGSVTMKSKTGKSVPLRVSLRTWGMAGGRDTIRLTEQGFVIVQLHSGKLRTIIDGKEQEREEGEFWVVPPGTQMSVEVKSEAAVLQTMALQGP